MYPNYDRITSDVHVRISDLPLMEELRSLRYVFTRIFCHLGGLGGKFKTLKDCKANSLFCEPVLSLSAGCRRNSPAGFLAGDHSEKHNGHFALSLSRLNLIYSRQPNFLATTLVNPTFCALQRN